jgi:uncharacterized protein with HEPN domain
MRRNKSSLIDIFNACVGTILWKSISRFINKKTKEDFFNDEMMHEAVIRKIEIIGEASGRISNQFIGTILWKKRFPQLPWRKMKSMRNILIHMYDEVELEFVWDTATKDIPALKNMVSKIIPLLDDQD